MTGRDLKAWRYGLGLKVHEAADVFGISRATMMRWEATTDPLPRYVELACEAATRRLTPSA